jgi:hypothetical protein
MCKLPASALTGISERTMSVTFVKCSTLLIIRKIQIKASWRYHYTLTIKMNTGNSNCWWGYKAAETDITGRDENK